MVCLPIVSKIEVGDGGVAERAHGELGYVVARHVEVAKHGARHSRQSGEAIPTEVQHLQFKWRIDSSLDQSCDSCHTQYAPEC